MTDENMTIDDLTSSRFLRQVDIKEPVNLTISEVTKENVAKSGAKPQIKWALVFEEFDKPMILNGTNGRRLANILGSKKGKDWIGKQIQLYVDPDVEFAGEIVGGLRVREASEVPF